MEAGGGDTVGESGQCGSEIFSLQFPPHRTFDLTLEIEFYLVLDIHQRPGVRFAWDRR